MKDIKTKSSSLTVRLHPEIKDLIERLAKEDRRAIANWLEVIVIKEAREKGVPIETCSSAHP